MQGVVVLSTADLDSPVWTNKQFIADGLAREWPTTYIESLGLRRPTFNVTDLRRLSRRLSPSPRLTDRQKRATNVHDVVSPHVLPLHGMSAVRAANGVLLRRQMLRHLPDFPERVLWTFSPLTYGLASRAKATVYHSVDLLHEIPGLPRQTLLTAERRILETAEFVVASSTGVQAHLNDQGRKDVLLWENVADSQLFVDASHGATRRSSALFAGNLTPTKIDLELMLDLAHAGVGVELAGPADIDGQSSRSMISLLEHPLVRRHGNLAPADLATLASTATVGIIPYNVNSYTAGVFPMKVYEYLAAGLQIVSTPLPSLMSTQELIPGLTLAHRDNFVAAVTSILKAPERARMAERQKYALQHSWAGRIGAAADLIRSIYKTPAAGR